IRRKKQLASSRVAAPRAQFIKAAGYDPAFRSCTQSGRIRRCIGSSEENPMPRRSKRLLILNSLASSQWRVPTSKTSRLIAMRNLKFPESKNFTTETRRHREKQNQRQNLYHRGHRENF